MAHLTASQIAHFEEQGYLVVDDLFDPRQILIRSLRNTRLCWTGSLAN